MAPKQSHPPPNSRTASSPETSLFPTSLDSADLFSLQFTNNNGGTTANGSSNGYALPMSAFSAPTMNARRGAYTAFTPFLPSGASGSQSGQQQLGGQQTQYMPTFHLHTVHPESQPLVTSPTTLSLTLQTTTNATSNPSGVPLKRKSTTDLSPGITHSDTDSPDWDTSNLTSEPLTVSIAAASVENGAGNDSGGAGGSKRTKTQRACDPCRRKKIR